MRNKPSSRDNQGMALMMALFFVSMALIFLGALVSRLVSQTNQTTRFQEHEEAFYGLEAGYSEALFEVENGGDLLVGVDEWTPTSRLFPELEFDVEGVSGLTMETLPDVRYFAVAQNWINDNLDNNGNGQTDEASENFYYTIYAAAKRANVTRRVEAVVVGRDVNVWRNAIFAGAGQSGGLINGNVGIYGSVHLLGDNLNMGTTALAAMDLSGTSLVHNNYQDMPANIKSRIPALPTYVENGVNVETLDANLRVKNGLVGLSGNSEIGQANVVGDTKKDFIDGTFVNDGWTGNAVTPDGDRGDPKSVFSDNGWDAVYDLGDKVSLPILIDDWRAPITGQRVANPDTGTWYTHQDYFNQVLVASPTNKTDGVYAGNITLNTKGSNFYWNATKNITSTSIPNPLPPSTDDYILFNSSTDVLRVSGQVTVNGSVTFTGSGNQRTILYSGRGALLAKENVTIDTDLMTINGGVTTNTANSFPVNNILGIMTAKDMVVGSTAQCTIMGAFYAQGKIACSKQTNVAGTFVSNYFDMGTNVPSIFQVPTLADNLPLGMIGNFPIMSMSRLSWREL
jgi:hypothetical protein